MPLPGLSSASSARLCAFPLLRFTPMRGPAVDHGTTSWVVGWRRVHPTALCPPSPGHSVKCGTRLVGAHLLGVTTRRRIDADVAAGLTEQQLSSMFDSSPSVYVLPSFLSAGRWSP